MEQEGKMEQLALRRFLERRKKRMIPVTRFLLKRPGERGWTSFFQAPRAPVVVWHLTSPGSLRCRHCYAATEDRGELTPSEERRLLDELAALGVPVLLLSGGRRCSIRDSG